MHPSLWIMQRAMGALPSAWSNIFLLCSDIYHSESSWHFLSLPKKMPNIFLGRSLVFLKLTEKRLTFSLCPACAESHQKVFTLSSTSNLGIGDLGFALRNPGLVHDSTQGAGVSQQNVQVLWSAQGTLATTIPVLRYAQIFGKSSVSKAGQQWHFRNYAASRCWSHIIHPWLNDKEPTVKVNKRLTAFLSAFWSGE